MNGQDFEEHLGPGRRSKFQGKENPYSSKKIRRNEEADLKGKGGKRMEDLFSI